MHLRLACSGLRYQTASAALPVPEQKLQCSPELPLGVPRLLGTELPVAFQVHPAVHMA